MRRGVGVELVSIILAGANAFSVLKRGFTAMKLYPHPLPGP